MNNFRLILFRFLLVAQTFLSVRYSALLRYVSSHSQHLPSSQTRMSVLLTIIAISIAVGFTGCVSLRSEYPKTTFYRLDLKPAPEAAFTISEGLLVKPFSIDSEFDTDHIITLVNATETQPLHYHRWASEPQELIAAYMANRIQQIGVFTKGVFTPSSSVVPEYQLEGRITECLARNAPATPANTVSLTIHLTLQRLDEKAQQTVVLQKVYSQSVQRSSDAASGIAPALSEAVALVTDALLKDVAALRK